MVGTMGGQVNESQGVGAGSTEWLAKNLRTLSQVPRRETLGSTRKLTAGALVDRVLRFFSTCGAAVYFGPFLVRAFDFRRQR
jgi:hypothetical protein